MEHRRGERVEVEHAARGVERHLQLAGVGELDRRVEEHLVERALLKELHDKQHLAPALRVARVADAEELHDVGVVQRRKDLGLCKELLIVLRRVGQSRTGCRPLSGFVLAHLQGADIDLLHSTRLQRSER